MSFAELTAGHRAWEIWKTGCGSLASTMRTMCVNGASSHCFNRSAGALVDDPISRKSCSNKKNARWRRVVLFKCSSSSRHNNVLHVATGVCLWPCRAVFEQSFQEQVVYQRRYFHPQQGRALTSEVRAVNLRHSERNEQTSCAEVLSLQVKNSETR